MIFNKGINKSPVNQSFIWVADYMDGSYLSEFDFYTKQENSFYNIKREELLRFGLIGEGLQVFFDVPNGVFNINGHEFKIQYIDETGKIYPLNGTFIMYKDIITYKNAVSDTNPFRRDMINGRTSSSDIVQYNIGYKMKTYMNGVSLSYQVIACMPFNENMYFEIKVTSEKDMNGMLVIKRNENIVDEIQAPLVKNKSGLINWSVK